MQRIREMRSRQRGGSNRTKNIKRREDEVRANLKKETLRAGVDEQGSRSLSYFCAYFNRCM